MKNRKLYESIQNLVARKGSVKKNKSNFAQQYCREQMKRKKLIPKTSTSKIDCLLKNFKTINTYIDVQQLIECVNQLYLEQSKQMKKQAQNHAQLHKSITHVKYHSESFEPKVLKLAKYKLKEHNLRKYKNQNEAVSNIVSEFEKRSNYLADTFKNKQTYAFASQFCSNKKKKIDSAKDDEESKQKWNLYARAATFTKTDSQQQPTFRDQNHFQLSASYKKKKKLFELAQVYLQIILQQQHRKKWGCSNKKQMQAFKINLAKISNKRNSGFKQNMKQGNITCQIKEYGEENIKDQTDSTDFTKYIRQNHSRKNTKMIRQKDIAIRKVNNFLMELQEDQLCLQNEKKSHLNHLDQLQKHIDENANFQDDIKIWRDQQKYQQIMQVLKKQYQK